MTIRKLLKKEVRSKPKKVENDGDGEKQRMDVKS